MLPEAECISMADREGGQRGFLAVFCSALPPLSPHHHGFVLLDWRKGAPSPSYRGFQNVSLLCFPLTVLLLRPPTSTCHLRLSPTYPTPSSTTLRSIDLSISYPRSPPSTHPLNPHPPCRFGTQTTSATSPNPSASSTSTTT